MTDTTQRTATTTWTIDPSHSVIEFAVKHGLKNIPFFKDAARPVAGTFLPLTIWEDNQSVYIEAEIPGAKIDDVELEIRGPKVVSSSLHRSVIRSDERLDYDRVDRVLHHLTRTVRATSDLVVLDPPAFAKSRRHADEAIADFSVAQSVWYIRRAPPVAAVHNQAIDPMIFFQQAFADRAIARVKSAC